jgi:hypothetical protein
MVNPVQPVGKRSIEPTRIEPTADRSSLASSAAIGPAAPPALSAPATVVQLSDAVFARQRGVIPGRARHDARGKQPLSPAEAARAHALATSTAVRNDAAAAVAAQANTPAERVYALLFE